MFKHIDLSKKMSKDEFESVIPSLRQRIGELQRTARDAGLPVIIVFEGWEAARMVYILNQFIHPLDPRGFNYYNIGEPDGTEKARPFLWRFWMRTPAKGRIAIFDRSWYSRTVAECVDQGKCKRAPPESIREINIFEKELCDDGSVIIKLFLHTSERREKKELDRVKEGELEACGLVQDDLDIQRHYDKFLPILEELIEGTDTPYAPWTIVESDDFEYAVVKLFRTVIALLENRLVNIRGTPPVEEVQEAIPLPAPTTSREHMDLTKKTGESDYNDKLEKYQGRMRGIQCDMFNQKRRLIVVFEGRDASGKGGNIARLTQTLNPRTYEVVPIFAPNDSEKSHHYLWRFIQRIPPKGHITIFDRSWYGRVLVERVEGFASEKEWRRAYREINMFEQMLMDDGATIVKIWLEIDRDVQLKRFNERVEDPKKVWKITADDWQAREKWDQYSLAIDEMLLRTSTSQAPWTIVESNDKYFSRLKTIKTVMDAAENDLK